MPKIKTAKVFFVVELYSYYNRAVKGCIIFADCEHQYRCQFTESRKEDSVSKKPCNLHLLIAYKLQFHQPLARKLIKGLFHKPYSKSMVFEYGQSSS